MSPWGWLSLSLLYIMLIAIWERRQKVKIMLTIETLQACYRSTRPYRPKHLQPNNLASLISSNSKLFGGTNDCHCLAVIIYHSCSCKMYYRPPVILIFMSQFVGPWWMMLGPTLEMTNEPCFLLTDSLCDRIWLCFLLTLI